MAGAHRHAHPGMTSSSPSTLSDLPTGLRAEFFEAVRQVIAGAGIETTGPAIGGDVPPTAEPIRFVAMRGMRHPDAEIASATQEDAGGQVRMEAAFMGLIGPMGVMPDHYTELVVARDRARDEAFGALIDLFNHRAISLFYRAWAKYRVPVAFGDTKGALTDPVSRLLAALAGLAGLAGPGGDPRILGAAGLLARRVRSPDALGRVLAALYGLPVEIIELEPRRIRIDADEQTRLGDRATSSGAYALLSANAVLGTVVTDVAGRFRIRVGPIGRERFDQFFPPNTLHAEMVATVRQVIGPTADFDIQLLLDRDEVPGSRTGTTTRLGQTSWLMHGKATENRLDAVLPGQSTGSSRGLPHNAGQID